MDLLHLRLRLRGSGEEPLELLEVIADFLASRGTKDHYTNRWSVF
jgi:hypothetical protein